MKNTKKQEKKFLKRPNKVLQQELKILNAKLRKAKLDLVGTWSLEFRTLGFRFFFDRWVFGAPNHEPCPKFSSKQPPSRCQIWIF